MEVEHAHHAVKLCLDLRYLSLTFLAVEFAVFYCYELLDTVQYGWILLCLVGGPAASFIIIVNDVISFVFADDWGVILTRLAL